MTHQVVEPKVLDPQRVKEAKYLNERPQRNSFGAQPRRPQWMLNGGPPLSIALRPWI